jgi:hypothetical protein
MTEHELVREWTAAEAAEKGVAVSGESVTPKVSRKAGASSGADHHPGIAPAAEDKNPGLPPDPPRVPPEARR